MQVYTATAEASTLEAAGTTGAETTEVAAPLSSIALELGPFTVHWYGVILGLAVAIGLMVAIREGKRHGLASDLFLDLVLYGVPLGIIGGRLYYVVFNWDQYAGDPLRIIAVWEGGLAIHGVLIAAVLLVIGFCYKRNLSLWKTLDILAPGIILAQAIGRWGNFMNQEAHGGVASRAFLEDLYLPEFIINQMYIENANPGGGLDPGFYYHHPTFLYESLWNLAGFALLLVLRRVNWSKFTLRQGEIFFSYLIWYSIGRFFIEGMRTDSLMIGDVLRTAQLMSLLLVIAGVAAIIYRRKNRLAPPYWEETGHTKGPIKTNKPGKKGARNHQHKTQHEDINSDQNGKGTPGKNKSDKSIQSKKNNPKNNKKKRKKKK